MTATSDPEILAGVGAAVTRRPRPRLSRGWLYLLPAFLFLLLFFVGPLGAMIWQSLHVKTGSVLQPGLSLQNYEKFFEQTSLWGAMVNSFELTALTVAVSLPLAYAMAASVAFAIPKRWHVPVLVLTVLPFWTSYVVRTYAWLLVLGDQGLINSALMSVGLIDAHLSLVNARAGVLIVFVHYFTMIMTLTIFVNLRRIPENLIRAARDLGASPVRVFLTVILPLSIPGVATGIFLTIVLAIGDYVTPQIIGGGSELTMPQAIMLQVSRLANTPMAAALSFFLTICVVASVIVFSPWLKTRGVRR